MVTSSTLSDRKQIPSVVDMVVDWLKASTEVTAICDQRISSTRPVNEDSMQYPWLLVKRIVGANMFPEAPLDRARVQFDAMGGVKGNGAPDWGPADQLIRAVEMEIRTTLQVHVPGKGYLRGIQTLEGMQQLIDPDTDGARFWMDAVVVAVPE